MSFKDKVVLVTGGSSGIGASAALAFAREGARVAIVGRNEAKLGGVAEQCAALGAAPLVLAADVSRDADLRRVVDTLIRHYGRLDVLINNAGIGGALSGSPYIYYLLANIRARATVVLVTNLCAPYLIKSKGVIVNISSVLGSTLARSYDRTIYGLSKAALDHFSKGIALELSAHGVRVNVVSPGPTVTDFYENNGINATWEDARQLYGLDRVSEPGEIADLILYLSSDKAKSIVGANYVIDNGALLKN